ncbi:MAG TPA: hypothetical protein VK335_35090 [Bryobacteraceae bacterium]|nr:hypothetical protein [Bryobacteraceae bacterium]
MSHRKVASIQSVLDPLRAGTGGGGHSLAFAGDEATRSIHLHRLQEPFRIAAAFGVSAASLMTFDGYWDLIQRIWNCPWWKAPQPRAALDRRIWNARVALLDSLYYLDAL